MTDVPIHRRAFLKSTGAFAAAMTLPVDRLHAQAAAELPTIPIPPPITSAERLQRIAKARSLMARHGIDAIIVGPAQVSTISPASNGGARSA